MRFMNNRRRNNFATIEDFMYADDADALVHVEIQIEEK